MGSVSKPLWSLPQVKVGSPVVTVYRKEKSSGVPSFVTYGVGITDLQALNQGSLSTSLFVSSYVSDQTIEVPIRLMAATGPPNGMYVCRFYHFWAKWQIPIDFKCSIFGMQLKHLVSLKPRTTQSPTFPVVLSVYSSFRLCGRLRLCQQE